jgi:signal transduction histidine kinase/CheY-like chemotaxis protein
MRRRLTGWVAAKAWRPVAFVVASTLAVCGVRVLLGKFEVTGVPYVLFLASVAASAFVGGWRAGALATLLGLVLGTYFFAAPQLALWASEPADWIGALVFLVAAAIIVLTLRAEAAARREVQQQQGQLLAEESHRRRLEAEVADSRRLEAVGKLAGGVAHDFNNLLTVVQGSAALLRDELPKNDLLDSIEVAAQRGAALTRQLLGFARRQMLTVEPVDLNGVVEEGLKLFRRLLPEDIEVVSELQAEPWQVLGDRTQLQQVLLNLVTNARDALPSGGQIRITTRNATLDERFAARYPEVSPGEYAQLSVTDNGVGMSDELQRRVFEPFFTTKDSGKGTGLGLAVTHGIVKQMHGHISLSSRSPGGTRFDVYWPREKAVATSAALSERGAPDLPALTILVVDDDELVRNTTCSVLSKLGHRVLAAESGAAALEVARRESGVIDVLLTDVVMPWMNGRELADRLCRLRSGLCVLFMSGYSENVVLNRGVVKPGIELLVKPFGAEELDHALRKVTRARVSAS